MKTDFDVLVVGSGTAGCFFAHEMAKQGYSVCVIDKTTEEKLGDRLQIFHIDKVIFDRMGVPRPEPGDPDYKNEFKEGTYYSPYGQYMKRNDGTEKIVRADYPFLVSSLPPFLKRLRAWCEELDVTFMYETEFKEFIYEGNRIVGARALKNGETIAFSSRLVADCSGIPAVARRKLRKPTTVPDFEVGPREMMYVMLEYVKLSHPERDLPKCAEHWAYYKGWIAQTGEDDVAIFGTGANLSYEYAQKCFQRFKKNVEMPEGTVIKREKGVTPFRPAPYSMVDNGFICMGDAACMTKWIGEGISSGWVGCKYAAETAGKAMQNGRYPTQDSLWGFNVKYNTTQAADFAYIMSTVINAVDCSADEMDYEFRKGIVFTDKAMTEMNWKWNADMAPADIAQLVGRVAVGTVSGNIKLKTVGSLVKGIAFATLLQTHYRSFPKTADKYNAWAKKCDMLWEKTGNMADMTERLEARLTAEGK